MKRLTIAACAMGSLLVALPAFADVVVKDSDWSSRPTRMVYYSDLNLDNQQGIDTLSQRLTSAVKFVCGNADVRVLDEMSQMRQCRRDSLGRAFAERDALIAARMAARGNPTELARLDKTSLRVAP